MTSPRDIAMQPRLPLGADRVPAGACARVNGAGRGSDRSTTTSSTAGREAAARRD